MALQITNTDNVSDNATLELDSAAGIATATHNGTTYLYVTGANDDGLSVFSVAADGTLSNVANISDDATLRLDSAVAATTASIGGRTYLFVTGGLDHGASMFEVEPDGNLLNRANVVDDATLRIHSPHDVTTAQVGGTIYLFVTGFNDHGLSVFSVSVDGQLLQTTSILDNATLELTGAAGVATAQVGGTTYLFATGAFDDGVSVFSVAANGSLTNTANVSDDATLALDGASHVTTANVGGTTYLFVTGLFDNGVSVFSVAPNGALTNVDNVFDDPTLPLGGASGVTTAVIAGTTYLFVAAAFDNAVAVFAVAASGALTPVANLGDDATRELAGPVGVTTALVGGATYLFAAGQADDGVSVFSLIDVPTTGPGDTQLGDVLWRHADGRVATATHDLGAVANNWRIATTGDFDADRDTDIMWRHRDGLVVTWEMEDGQYLVNHNIAFASTGWEIVDTGDFDADGDADVLWRHRDGAVVTWEMENGEYVVNHNIAFASVGWEIDGLGDFDADGDADVIWRHRDGAVVTWEMQDGQYVVNHNIAFGSTSWEIAGTGDFDGDGDADILWRHRDGDVVTWEMQGGGYVTNHSLPALATTWQIAGSHDFDSDGDADILWRHDQGGVMTWEMESGAFVTNHDFGAVSNGWRIQATGEFDLT